MCLPWKHDWTPWQTRFLSHGIPVVYSAELRKDSAPVRIKVCRKCHRKQMERI